MNEAGIILNSILIYIIPEVCVGLVVKHAVAVLEICNGREGIARTTLNIP